MRGFSHLYICLLISLIDIVRVSVKVLELKVSQVSAKVRYPRRLELKLRHTRTPLHSAIFEALCSSGAKTVHLWMQSRDLVRNSLPHATLLRSCI